MSTSNTGAEQHRRLHALGLGVELLAELRDVDTWADAVAVAAAVPASGFAATVERISRHLGPVRANLVTNGLNPAHP